MSTRAVIAQWKDGGESTWEGRYHHWDGYPSGLGAELHEIHGTVFNRDTAAMRQFLIADHPGGWSTIQDADWSKPAKAYDRQDYACEECGAHNLAHYRQYYRDTPRLLPPPSLTDPVNPVLVLGHKATGGAEKRGPECSCHNLDGRLRDGVDDQWVTEYGDDAGTEWAYVLGEYEITVFERKWPTGEHVVGMFGEGAGTTGHWKRLDSVPWTATMVDWESFEKVMA